MSWFTSIGGNRIVLALSVARLGDAIANSILFVIIPLYVAKLPSAVFSSAEPIRAAILVSIFGLANASFQPLAGMLSDRLQRRKLLIMLGLGLMAVATFAFITATRFLDLLVFRVVQGIGLGMAIPASMAVLTQASHQQTRGGSMGIYTSSRMVGLALGPLIGGLLHDYFSFDAAFYTATALLALAILLIQLWITDPHQPARRPHSESPTQRNRFQGPILGAALATFVMATAFSMVTPLERQFNERLGESAFAFGLAFTVVMVGRLIFQVPFGRLSDHLGRKPLIIAGLLLMAPSTALLGEVHTTLQFIGLRTIQGIGSAAVAAPAFALAADSASAGSQAKQLSIATMGFGLGIAVGPMIGGVLDEISFRLPFIVVGAMLIVSAWIIHRYTPDTVSRRKKPHGS